MMRARLPTSWVLLIVCGLLSLVGCRAQTEVQSPPVDTSTAFSAAGTAPVADRWWTAFDDERLNTVVDSATAANFDVKAAWQRLRAAQAVVDRESGALFPDLEGAAGGTVQGTEPNGARSETLRLALSSAYEVDLWGQIRSQVEAERFRAQASRAEYQTAVLSVAAEVVRTWYRLAEVRSQLRLVADQIATNETVVELLEARFKTGQIERVDILRQRQLLQATRERQTILQSEAAVVEHRLAVLLGRPPQAEIATMPDTLPDLPPLPETGVPMDLVRRRPDVRRAHRRLLAADRDLAVAITNQYPRLTLSADVSSAASNASALFETWAYSFAGNLLAPIFKGGALRAEVDRAEAVKKQRLYTYGQATLTAFQEVEDALIQEEKQRQRIEDIEKQVDLARESYQQLRVQYLNGAADYLDVLTALDEVQQLQRDLLAARRVLIEDRIALYRALAGSIHTEREQDQ